MPNRGLYGFEIQPNGNPADTDANLELLRKLFRDGTIIQGKFGPGNPGDFDIGSWHILCHLAGGSAVLDLGGQKLWAGITHKGFPDAYEASLVSRDGGGLSVLNLKSDAGKAKIASSSRKFASGVGFSNGCAALALKKPPPFVPSCLMAICEATGPIGRTCSVMRPPSAEVVASRRDISV